MRARLLENGSAQAIRRTTARAHNAKWPLSLAVLLSAAVRKRLNVLCGFLLEFLLRVGDVSYKTL